MTQNNVLAIGCTTDKEGWTPFDGITSVEALTHFIEFKIQTIRDNGYKPEPIAGDGCTKPGYLVECMRLSFAQKTEDGIIAPYFGIFTVKPYEVFYHQ